MGRRIGGAGGGSDPGGISGAAVAVAVAGVIAVGGAGTAGLEGAAAGSSESLTGPNLTPRKTEDQKSARVLPAHPVHVAGPHLVRRR
jgi:hypothetical protein